MLLKINGTALVSYPKEVTITTLDIDDGESSVRTADGTLTRDRIAVKRQLELSWGMLTWAEMSSIMQAMAPTFFSVYYPDPLLGVYTTKTFYVGNRPCPVAISKGATVVWSGLQITLTEK